MRKIAAVSSIIFGVLVLGASTSRTVMQKIAAWREQAPWDAWWAPHQVAAAGDLVRMSYLEEIPVFRDTNLEVYTKAEEGNKSVNLYLWGDSYVKNIPDSAFYGLKSFHFGRRDYSDLVYDLDTSEKNILVLSIGERFVRTVFFNTEIVYSQVKRSEKATAFVFPYRYVPAPKRYASILPNGYHFGDLFNPAVNQNIEYNLFSYNLLNPVRVLKANMNARLFGRATGDVVMSDDGTYLFLRQTVSSTGTESSYAPLTGTEVSYFISVVNEVCDHYKKQGFDEVYLSIIPNPVSVIQPELYNNLIPDMQDHGRAYAIQAPVIDVYSELKKTPRHYYLRGDTHWNHYGREVWLRKVNAMLQAWDNGVNTQKLVW